MNKNILGIADEFVENRMNPSAIFHYILEISEQIVCKKTDNGNAEKLRFVLFNVLTFVGCAYRFTTTYTRTLVHHRSRSHFPCSPFQFYLFCVGHGIPELKRQSNAELVNREIIKTANSTTTIMMTE